MDRHRGRDVGLAILAAVAIALAAVAAAPLFTQTGGNPAPPDEPTSEQPSADELEVDGAPIGFLLVIFSIVFRLWQILSAHILKFQLTQLEPAEVPGLGPTESLDPQASTTPEPTPNGTDGLGQGTGPPLFDDLTILVVVAGVLVIVGLLAIRRDGVRSAIGLAAADGDTDADADDLHAVGRIAGDAADRMAGASTPKAAENAVYHAWSEMVALLDVPDPRSDTPRQFAASAIDAGMDPDDVALLTETFEAVRYGDAPPSEDRRERASEAFRRIEAEYGRDDDFDDESKESR